MKKKTKKKKQTKNNNNNKKKNNALDVGLIRTLYLRGIGFLRSTEISEISIFFAQK